MLKKMKGDPLELEYRYTDIIKLLEQAVAMRGLIYRCNNTQEAYHLRVRLNKARALHRKAAPLKMSIYDSFMITIPRNEDGE